MSELINNSQYRKNKLKELILKLHKGISADEVRRELMETLKSIPYGEVVEVEQELMQDGLPQETVLELCDVHGAVLEGNIDRSAAKEVPDGHPVDVFIQENKMLLHVIKTTTELLNDPAGAGDKNIREYVLKLQSGFNELLDVDKHYKRKEYLVFPYLEKNDITGVPKVMWGKHNEIREQLKGCIEVLGSAGISLDDIMSAKEVLFIPALRNVKEMVQKEEEILFPMCMDVLTTEDWWHINRQTIEIGFTLYDPQVEWFPEGFTDDPVTESLNTNTGNVQLPSGSFTAGEIMAIMNTIPVDMTFVDKDDKVKYFTQGSHRIFNRNRSIINRDVRLCHPPGSVHIIEKILDDFKSGKASRAPFWIQIKGRFIHIEYFALRNDQGAYLGTLEMSQDITDLRELEGEQRILSYEK